jgi:hypothetical protein
VKILQVNSSDIIGSRFNGFDARHLLAEAGIESHHLVWNKLSDASSSSVFFDTPGSRKATRAMARAEARLSVHSRLQIQSYSLPLHRALTSLTIISFTTAILDSTHFPC